MCKLNYFKKGKQVIEYLVYTFKKIFRVIAVKRIFGYSSHQG